VNRQRYQVEARARAAESEATARRIAQEQAAQRRVTELLAANERENERRLVQDADEAPRRLSDTGPIRGLVMARNAAARSATARRIRTVARRTADREPAGV
jgi:hypothetical protein